MSGEDVPPGRAGGWAMVEAMGALLTGSPPGDGEDLPPRYTPATLVAWTLLGVLVSIGSYLVRLAIGGISPLWLLSAPVMFLPLLLAWSTNPPRRNSGVVVGSAVGVLAGVVVGFGVRHLARDGADPVLLGLVVLAAVALVAAWTFGGLTRERARLR